jgi:aspartyl-tRNA(Asn)/glutamyl-tRNA(Gln) amidotransferase subunit B
MISREMLDEIKQDLPEMPDMRRERFMNELLLNEEDAQTLTENRALADFYEETLQHFNQPKAVANVIMTEVLRVLNEESITISDFTITSKRLAELISLKDEDKINSSAMQQILTRCWKMGRMHKILQKS